MNAKKAKILRKMANRIALEKHLADQQPIIQRKLMVHPAHEHKVSKVGMGHVTAVNHPQSVRGIYRWLKHHA